MVVGMSVLIISGSVLLTKGEEIRIFELTIEVPSYGAFQQSGETWQQIMVAERG